MVKETRCSKICCGSRRRIGVHNFKKGEWCFNYWKRVEGHSKFYNRNSRSKNYHSQNWYRRIIKRSRSHRYYFVSPCGKVTTKKQESRVKVQVEPLRLVPCNFLFLLSKSYCLNRLNFSNNERRNK